MEGQWATFPGFKNIDPVKMKSMVVTKTDMQDTEIFVHGLNSKILQHNDFPEVIMN